MAWFQRLRQASLEKRATALVTQGNTLEDAGALDEALRCYRNAVHLLPTLARAHLNCGNVLLAMGDTQAALACYATALEHQPDYAAAYYNSGNARAQLGNRDAAIAAYEKAIALKPDFADAHLALGCIREDIAPDEDTEANYRKAMEKALAQDPQRAEIRWALAMAQLRPMYDDVQELSESRLNFARAIAELDAWFATNPSTTGWQVVGTTQPFYLAYQPQDNRGLLEPYGRLCTRLMAQSPGTHNALMAMAPKSRKLRIGFVSSQVQDHSVWNAITKGWILNLDPHLCESHIFSLGRGDDEETALARASAAHFVDTPRTLQAWEQTIADAQLDVLIYPEIGMDALTTQLASQRLAPVQAASWGHPHTTALPTLDLFLSAELLEPAEGDTHYTEKLIRLPNLGVCVQALNPKSVESQLSSIGLPDDEPLLLCPGAPFKYSPSHDEVWTALGARLQAHGAGRLVFFQHARTGMMQQLERRLRRAFTNAGVDFDRTVCVVPRLPREQFYWLMHRAVLMLDTIGFSGFNTALQGLECGLPVIAFEGEFMRGRLASGLLRRMGLDNCVAQTPSEFVDKAMALTQSQTFQSQLRQEIAQRRSLLFNDLEPVRALERVLTAAVVRLRADGSREMG